MRWIDMMSKGALGIFRGVLQALAHMCTRLKKIGEKRAFLDPCGSGCAWWVQILFGAGFFMGSVFLRIFNDQIATFVSNTSSLIFMTS